ncbi:hypothetical protein L6452_34573 [Arctium lappa]|uniref:Uncharacterized protein n=1 Tax=Arctium lappa TaxID=4217 RepID=A0ACB8YJQ5_ARCLA|nr:hypothetical protein L6452_34573 [Arctium lappa]
MVGEVWAKRTTDSQKIEVEASVVSWEKQQQAFGSGLTSDNSRGIWSVCSCCMVKLLIVLAFWHVSGEFRYIVYGDDWSSYCQDLYGMSATTVGEWIDTFVCCSGSMEMVGSVIE